MEPTPILIQLVCHGILQMPPKYIVTGGVGYAGS